MTRLANMPQGTVWWITGFSGAGKSTIGRLVAEGLIARGRPALVLDGDALRAVLGGTAGYEASDRRHLAGVYGRLAREVALQGIDAVCATVSMFHDVRRWNREHIGSYREIYLRVPMDALSARHPQNLYGRAANGEIGNVVGLHLTPEEPETPDLVIDNFGEMTPQRAAAKILTLADMK